MSAYEKVEHPDHYNQHPSGIECITVVQDFNFNVGNAIKYLWRAGMKPDADVRTDLAKARQYIDFELERLGQEELNDQLRLRDDQ